MKPSKEKFFAALKKGDMSKKLDLSVMSDLRQNMTLIENKYEDMLTSNNNLINGYQEYFDTLDRIIMDSSFIYGMSNKVETELFEASNLVDETQASIETLIGQFDELGIEPPSEVQNLLDTFFDIQNAINDTEQSFDGMDSIRNEAEDVNNATVSKQLNF